MANIIAAAAITLMIFSFIVSLVMACIYKPLITVSVMVFLCMGIVFKLIYRELKAQDDSCKDF